MRFERRDDGYKEVGNWSWDDNPFLGTREFEGLKVLMAILKNWDLTTRNNDIVTQKKNPGPQIYYVADLGATLGRTGTFLNGIIQFNMPAQSAFLPPKRRETRMLSPARGLSRRCVEAGCISTSAARARATG